MTDPIKVLQNEMACVNRQITGCDRDCIKCDLALEDSEVITAYEAAIEALKKQIPQKIIYKTIVNDYTLETHIFFSCPNCKRPLAFTNINYCQYCGHALTFDWSEVEE